MGDSFTTTATQRDLLQSGVSGVLELVVMYLTAAIETASAVPVSSITLN